MEYKMHRAVNIRTGEVTEVSDVIASDPNMMAEYGYMLQELPDQVVHEESSIDSHNEPEDSATGEVTGVSDESPAADAEWQNPIDENQSKHADAPAEEKPEKRAYNKKVK